VLVDRGSAAKAATRGCLYLCGVTPLGLETSQDVVLLRRLWKQGDRSPCVTSNDSPCSGHRVKHPRFAA